MAKYAANPEGVETLRSLSSQILQDLEDIRTAGSTLDSAITDDNGLGEHVNSIEDVIEQLKKAITDAEEPVNTVSSKLNALADTYQEIIDDDPYAGLNP